MKIALRCEVSKVEKRSDYNYSTYKNNEYTTSDLKILQNNDKITGTITLQGDLGFGKLYQLIVDLDNPIDVVSKAT